MKASWYAEALVAVLEKNEKASKKEITDIVARFHALVKARGHEALLKMIPRELARIAERQENDNRVTLVTADAKSRSKWEHAYDHYVKEGILSEEQPKEILVDESIIGGFQLKTKDTLIDGSYKKSLLELYRNITSK